MSHVCLHFLAAGEFRRPLTRPQWGADGREWLFRHILTATMRCWWEVMAIYTSSDRHSEVLMGGNGYLGIFWLPVWGADGRSWLFRHLLTACVRCWWEVMVIRASFDCQCEVLMGGNGYSGISSLLQWVADGYLDICLPQWGADGR